MIAIVGAGFSGLGLAVRLKEEGYQDFVILERADDLGGTWRDNEYPGCACDIPSHVYSFSFELNPNWTQSYATQPEIYAYLRRVADHYGLHRHIRYGHEVIDAGWDNENQQWQIQTTAGPVEARFLIAASGPLSEPSVPDLPGLGSFQGHTFHSATWDHEYSLEGKRVAVVGTGASAIQFVPQIQPQVSQMHIFQRTPPWLVPRNNRNLGRLERLLMRRLPFALKIRRGTIFSMQESRFFGFRNPRFMRLPKLVAQAHLRRQVKDPELRRKLTPDYVIGCKRILISSDYYPALAQPNVEVVTSGVVEVRANSVLDGEGREYEVDTILFGTGFQVTDPPIARHLRGKDGRTLAEHWQGGMQAYQGTTVAGFPNLFFMLGPNTGLGHNSMIYMIESQLNYVVDALRSLRAHGAVEFDVKPEVQNGFNEQIQRDMEGSVWTAGHCRSWYLDANGRNSTVWPRWAVDFRRRLRHFDIGSYILSPRHDVGRSRETVNSKSGEAAAAAEAGA